jgi:alpha-L-rhamnosidase
MSSQASELIIPVGLGDHMEPQPGGLSSHSPKRTPVDLTSTAWYYACTRIVADSARTVGSDEAADRYGRLSADIRRAFDRRFFDRRFFDRKAGHYGTGSQTSNLIPLWLGLTPAGRERDVLSHIVSDIRQRDDHLATGIMGTSALSHALPDHGAADVMLDVVRQTTFPSWGHQIEMGATTLWETWGDDPSGMSLNIWMFGSTQTFFYRDVAGMSPASPGWRDMTIRPRLTKHLDSARANVRTPRGDASVDWRHEGSTLRLDIEIPATSRADVWLPTSDEFASVIHDGDVQVWRDGEGSGERPGITSATRGDDHVRFEVGGGRYYFRVTPLPFVREPS